MLLLSSADNSDGGKGKGVKSSAHRSGSETLDHLAATAGTSTPIPNKGQSQ